MRRGALALTGMLIAGGLATTGCTGTAVATLRVRPPDLEPGDTREAQQLRVEESVRDVAAMGRLSCMRPAADDQRQVDDLPNGEILACLPSNVGTSPASVSLSLHREPSGYAVNIMESSGMFSRPRYLCSIQDRIEERVVFRLGGGTVKRDERRSCSKEGGQ